jgi:fructose-1,6-bisphosphatase/inositol monophosphatase family enzyme
MPFDTKDAAELIRIARQVARTEVMPRFRSLNRAQISTKKDAHDIVTEADIQAEAALTKALATAFPGAAVVGEEAVSADQSILERLAGSGRMIVVDPVDGTWNFASGQTNFGMILSVVEAGKTVFGVHLDPVMDDWIFAHAGGGAHWARDGATHPILTRDPLPVDQRIGFMSLALFPRALQPRLAGTFPDFGRILSPRCAAHEYRMLAEGHADFALSCVLNPWDHAAGTLIVTEAGGHAALLDGTAYSALSRRGTLLTAASKAVWEETAQYYDFLDL